MELLHSEEEDMEVDSSSFDVAHLSGRISAN